MKILFIAPFPPPLTGNSLPIKLLYESLADKHVLDRIDLSKKNHKAGVDSIGRVVQILGILFKVLLKHRKNDLIYLSVSESRAGNLRDILIYFLCSRNLKRIYIHMLGGAGMEKLLQKTGFWFRINRFFVSRIGGVVVEGQAQKSTFLKLISEERIKIAPNFAEEYLFVTSEKVKNKFKCLNPVRILFLSNMLTGKGHQELLESYLSLDEEIKEKVRIDFAGKIVEEKWGQLFLSHVNDEKNLEYHGEVNGEEKKNLFQMAHVFCLPTYYPYEGQPFTIIEAYATGNAVFTTDHSGIGHIFGIENGFFVQKQSISDLRDKICSIFLKSKELEKCALHNLELAHAKYNEDVFLNNVREFILKEIE